MQSKLITWIKTNKKLTISIIVGIIMITLLVLYQATCIFGNHIYANATCTKPKTCTKCHHTVGKPLGHDETINVISNPTINDEGKTEYYCKRCKKVLYTTYADPIKPTVVNHSFNFTKDEIIKYINNHLNVFVSPDPVDSDNSVFKVYDSNDDQIASLYVLCEGPNKSAIGVQSPEFTEAIAVATVIASKIDEGINNNQDETMKRLLINHICEGSNLIIGFKGEYVVMVAK